MPNETIDPLTGPSYGLGGKIVTMNPAHQILDRGIVYIKAGQIEAVKPANAPCPQGFEDSPIIHTRGTIYPGLIDLHNHLSYDALPLWNVPQKFSNRDQWGRKPDYRRLISGPMQVLGKTPGYVEAVVRYVECKCMLGGVTTSQGIALYSNQGIHKYYRGIVRNVEQTNETALPEAATKISDVEAEDADEFLERLERSSCLLLHLSEGIDKRARQHFRALQIEAGEWAITSALAGIHCAGLWEIDFPIMQAGAGSMIWSPLSNYLLYGDTANIKAAKSEGLLIGIGPDWSPTGSKNLLGELKIARLVSDELGGIFSGREILAMATIDAAKILKWDTVLGSIEAGKRADLLIISGRKGDPYDRLLKSKESSIILVVINGIPRYGQVSLMNNFSEGTEKWKVGRAQRIFNLEQRTADPIVGRLTLKEACNRLRDGMQKLRALALNLEQRQLIRSRAPLDSIETTWSLVLDHNELEGVANRHHLPFGPRRIPTGEVTYAVPRAPLSQVLDPIELDELTVVDDKEFLDRIAQQNNLPNFIKHGLPDFY